jgi:hypothetical protein
MNSAQPALRGGRAAYRWRTAQAGIRLLPLLLAACAAVPPPNLPPQLDPGPQARLASTLAAVGVQIYECRAATAGGAPQWTFVAPEARLFDSGGRFTGSHGAGPHWLADDGSRVQGRVTARADAPLPGAIPWLLLATTSEAPQGRFGGVTHIQRVRTQGGAAPAAGCDTTTIGAQSRVAYTADYRLFKLAAAR